jgi:quinol monooxygenase YgiN
MTTIVRVTGHILCPADDLELFRAALVDHVRLSRDEPGCLTFEITQDPADPCRWILDETFRDMAAFEAHRARARDSDWHRLTGHMDRDIRVSG